MKAFNVILFSVSLLLGSNSFAQIPVTDAALNMQTGLNQAQTMAQWAMQIAEMKSQYDQMTTDYELAKQQYSAITGSRGLGAVDYDSSIGGAITDTAELWGSTSKSKQIIADEKLTGSAAQMRTNIDTRSLQTAAARKASSLSAAQGAKQRLTQIEQLMGRISSTADQKAIEEVQARIAIEQAALANEQNRHQINMQAALAEEALIKEQKAAYNRKILDPTIQAMPSIK